MPGNGRSLPAPGAENIDFKKVRVGTGDFAARCLRGPAGSRPGDRALFHPPKTLSSRETEAR